MKTFENGKDYQLTNWIDCEATEFVGLSCGKIALHYNDELQVSIEAKPLIAIVRNCTSYNFYIIFCMKGKLHLLHYNRCRLHHNTRQQQDPPKQRNNSKQTDFGNLIILNNRGLTIKQ